MFIVIEEIVSPLSPCAVIYTAVFARDRRFELAEGMGKGFWGGFVIGGRFGGGCCWLRGLRKRGCPAVGPLEIRLAGGTEPLGEEER